METDRLGEVTIEITGGMEAIHAARDRVLSESRQIVRLSANAVRAAHRADFDAAQGLLTDAG